MVATPRDAGQGERIDKGLYRTLVQAPSHLRSW